MMKRLSGLVLLLCLANFLSAQGVWILIVIL